MGCCTSKEKSVTAVAENMEEANTTLAPLPKGTIITDSTAKGETAILQCKTPQHPTAKAEGTTPKGVKAKEGTTPRDGTIHENSTPSTIIFELPELTKRDISGIRQEWKNEKVENSPSTSGTKAIQKKMPILVEIQMVERPERQFLTAGFANKSRKGNGVGDSVDQEVKYLGSKDSSGIGILKGTDNNTPIDNNSASIATLKGTFKTSINEKVMVGADSSPKKDEGTVKVSASAISPKKRKGTSKEHGTDTTAKKDLSKSSPRMGTKNSAGDTTTIKMNSIGVSKSSPTTGTTKQRADDASTTAKKMIGDLQKNSPSQMKGTVAVDLLPKKIQGVPKLFPPTAPKTTKGTKMGKSLERCPKTTK